MLLPKVLTKIYAILLPKPDLINPAAKNIHIATIQEVELPNPAATSFMLNIPVKVAITTAIKVVAIIGNGLVIHAAIVATKIANKCQAGTLISVGLNGVTSHSTIPITKGRIHFFH